MLTKVSRSLIEDNSITPEKLALNSTGTGNVLVVNDSGQLELNEGIDLSSYALISYVDEQITNALTNGTIDLSDYALKTELFSGSYNDLAGTPNIPTNVSDLGNDVGYLTSHQDLSAYALKVELFSGSYNDLTNVPALVVSYNDLTDKPSIPQDLSDLSDTGNLLTTDFTGYATTGYVDTQLSNLVDTAPEALNTLNELATALGDDANFSTTITTLIGTKADSTTVTNLQNVLTSEIGTKATAADLATVATTGSYDDLTNTPSIPQNTVSTNDLETVAFSGLYNDLLLKPALFSGSYDDLRDKPSLFSGSYLDLTNVPTLFDGQYSSLVGAPTNISSFNNDTGYVTYTATSHIVPNIDNSLDLGNTSNQWRTIYGHTVEATYADLAERYEADAPYDEGTVLVFGGEAEVTACTMDTDVRVAGIVSVNPGLKLNSTAGNSETHPYIALKGRVPCKIIGPVKKGDLLVTSDTPGYARSVMGVDMGHAVLGKSLTTDLTGGEKLIEVFVV